MGHSLEGEDSAPHQAPPPPLPRHGVAAQAGQQHAGLGGRAARKLWAARLGGWAAPAGAAGGWKDAGRFPAHKAAPRAARPPPRGARSGRADGVDGSGGWSSFATAVAEPHRCIPGARLAEKEVWECGIQKKNRGFGIFCSWKHVQKPRFLPVTKLYLLERVSREFACSPPRSGPHPMRIPGRQMIRMGAGSSLSSQRRSGEPLSAFPCVRLAETVFWCVELAIL
eukprot:gene6542-biopygen22390